MGASTSVENNKQEDFSGPVAVRRRNVEEDNSLSFVDINSSDEERKSASPKPSQMSLQKSPQLIVPRPSSIQLLQQTVISERQQMRTEERKDEENEPQRQLTMQGMEYSSIDKSLSNRGLLQNQSQIQQLQKHPPREVVKNDPSPGLFSDLRVGRRGSIQPNFLRSKFIFDIGAPRAHDDQDLEQNLHSSPKKVSIEKSNLANQLKLIKPQKSSIKKSRTLRVLRSLGKLEMDSSSRIKQGETRSLHNDNDGCFDEDWSIHLKSEAHIQPNSGQPKKERPVKRKKTNAITGKVINYLFFQNKRQASVFEGWPSFSFREQLQKFHSVSLSLAKEKATSRRSQGKHQSFWLVTRAQCQIQFTSLMVCLAGVHLIKLLLNILPRTLLLYDKLKVPESLSEPIKAYDEHLKFPALLIQGSFFVALVVVLACLINSRRALITSIVPRRNKLEISSTLLGGSEQGHVSTLLKVGQLVLLALLFFLIQFEPTYKIEMSCVLGARSGHLAIIIQMAVYLTWIHLFFDSLAETLGFLIYVFMALGGTVYLAGLPPMLTKPEEEGWEADAPFSYFSMVTIGMTVLLESIFLGVVLLLPFVMNVKMTLLHSQDLLQVIKVKKHSEAKADILFNKSNRSSLVFKFGEKQKHLISRSSISEDIQPQTQANESLCIDILRMSSQFESTLPRPNPEAATVSVSAEPSVEFMVSPEIAMDQNLLHSEIFLPYLISNFTKLLYDKNPEKRLSVGQIISDIVDQIDPTRANQRIQLFFKTPGGLTKAHAHRELSSKKTPKLKKKWALRDKYRIFGDKDFQLTGNKQQDGQSMEEDDHLEIIGQQIKDLHMDEDSKYYEVSFKTLTAQDRRRGTDQEILMVIKDITVIVRGQQKISDHMYQESIEANYSHEQMTPLNSILNNAVIVRQMLEEMEDANAKSMTQLVRAIEYSGQIMLLYNKNQLQRMKILRKDAEKQITSVYDPEELIKQVILPFTPPIRTKQLNVQIIRRNNFMGRSFKADWKNFQLAIFNLIQNAVKYNAKRGDLFVILGIDEVKPYSNDEFNLEVDIIDSGTGIDKKRQKYLFVPFQELKVTQSLNKLKDNSIGLGLASTKVIMNDQNGDAKLIHSQKGLTVFRLNLKVKIDSPRKKNQLLKLNSFDDKNHQILFSFKREVSEKVQDYVNSQVTDESIDLNKMANKKYEENLDDDQTAKLFQSTCMKKGKSPKYLKSHTNAKIWRRSSLNPKRERIARKETENEKLAPKGKAKLSFNNPHPPPLSNELVLTQNREKVLKNRLLFNEMKNKSNSLRHLFPSSIQPVRLSPIHQSQLSKDLEHELSLMGNAAAIMNQSPIPDVVERSHTVVSSRSISLSDGRSQSRIGSAIRRPCGQIDSRNPREVEIECVDIPKAQSRKYVFPGLPEQEIEIARELTPNFSHEQKAKRLSLLNVLFQHDPIPSESLSDEPSSENSPSQGTPIRINDLNSSQLSNEIEEKLAHLNERKKDPQNRIKSPHCLQIPDQDFMEQPRHRGTIPSFKGPLLDNTHKYAPKRKLQSQDHLMVLDDDYSNRMSRQCSISSRSSFMSKQSRVSRNKDLLSTQQILSASCLEINSILLKNQEEEVKEEEKIPEEPNREFYAVADPITERDDEHSVSFMMGDALFKERGGEQSDFQVPSVEIPSQTNPSDRKTPAMRSRGLSFQKRFARKRIMSIKQQQEEDEEEKVQDGEYSTNSKKCSFLSCSSYRQSPLPRQAQLTDAEQVSPLHAQHSLRPARMPSGDMKQTIISPLKRLTQGSHTSNKCNCQPKILLVDDNEFNLIPLQTLIESLFKIQTVKANDGKEAVETYQEHFQLPCKCENRAFKFIFMDLQMPEMDGFKASELILEMTKESGEPNLTHIVALTAYTSSETRTRVLKIGMKDLINKPLHHGDLHRMVQLHFYRISLREFNRKYPQFAKTD